MYDAASMYVWYYNGARVPDWPGPVAISYVVYRFSRFGVKDQAYMLNIIVIKIINMMQAEPLELGPSNFLQILHNI